MLINNNNSKDLDLCLIDVNDIIQNCGNVLLYNCIDIKSFITNEIADELTAIENVVMIGYPEGIMDYETYLPVVRKGITATRINRDYKGNKEFLIDIATFHGSSGSPVFLQVYNIESINTDDKAKMVLKPDYYFVGILRSSEGDEKEGSLVFDGIPNSIMIKIIHEYTFNLGVVIKAEVIREMLSTIDNPPEDSNVL